MIELNPRSDDFVLTLPNELLPPDVYKAYDSKLLSKYNATHDSILGYIQESLQTVTIPDADLESLEQISQNKTEKTPALIKRIGDITDTKLALEFRSSNAMVNYLICYYSFYLRKFNPKYNKLVGDMVLSLNDKSFGFQYRIIFKNCDWTGVSGQTLTYNSEITEYRTFSLSFAFNDMEMDFTILDEEKNGRLSSSTNNKC